MERSNENMVHKGEHIDKSTHFNRYYSMYVPNSVRKCSTFYLFSILMRFLYLFLFLISCFESFSQSSIKESDSLKEFKHWVDSTQDVKEQFIILHIGDSHMQPNNLSGMVRYSLQQKYGNSGRGLIFPYTLAKTNGPKDVKFSSNVEWENAWIIKPHEFKIGLTGISIRSKSQEGTIKWKSGVDSLVYPCTNGLVSFEIEGCKECFVIVNGRKKKYWTNSSIMDTIHFEMGLDSNSIEFSGGKFVLLDLIEKNSNLGILYHSTGVAGATFQSYVQNPYFENELGLFNPDLIIISLGTNESVKTWNQTKFESEVNAFLAILNSKLPFSKIILVLPNENYIMKNNQWILNERIDYIRSSLSSFANNKNVILYDQQKSMGGIGCMLLWEKKGLVNKDHIHFLKKGYQEQGRLLFKFLDGLLI